MIAEKEKTRVVTSTLADQADNYKMRIADEAQAHVMDILSKQLYSDPRYAVLREYSTNAWDAHVAAGVTRPIEITLPTRMSPYLKIRDYGIGLDKSEIEDIYSQYGKSTKTSSNDFNGMLGLGCKSGFAYTDQFTVTSTKNGFTIQVSCERSADGTGVQRVVSEMPDSTAHDGTTIMIASKSDNYEFENLAKRFFRVWPKGTVLVNGEEPTRIDGLWLNDKIVVIEGEQSYVVMGNVPYPAEIKHNLPRGYVHHTYISSQSVMAFVDIGEVSFPASREELRMTSNTLATIERIEDEVHKGLRAAVQKRIDSHPTAREAAQDFIGFAANLGMAQEEFFYGGEPLPLRFKPETKLSITRSSGGTPEDVGIYVTRNDSMDKLTAAQGTQSLGINDWGSTVFVWGYDKARLTATQKRKLLQWEQSNVALGSTYIKRFAMIAEKPNRRWTELLGKDHIVAWSEIEEIKLPKREGGALLANGRLAGSYDLYEGLSKAAMDDITAQGGTTYGYQARYEIAGDDIDQTRPIYYLHGNMYEASNYIELLAAHHRKTGCYIVPLSANRIEKFLRNVPTARKPEDGIKEAFEAQEKAVTSDEKLALHIYENGVTDDLVKFDMTRIDDPDLKEAIRVANIPVEHIRKRRQKYQYLLPTTSDTVQWSNPLNRYPLFGAYYSYYGRRASNPDAGKHGNDMYLYINAKYADLKSKGL